MLTEKWTDWVDYWAVDFDYEKKREIIRVPVEPNRAAHEVSGGEDPLTAGVPSVRGSSVEWEERWTGEYIFENEWQSFRTNKDRTLELTSAAKEIEAGKVGRRKIAVKVVDIYAKTIVDVTVPTVPTNQLATVSNPDGRLLIDGRNLDRYFVAYGNCA